MNNIDLNQHENGVFYINNQDKAVIGIAAKNANKTNYNLDFGKIRKYEKYLLHTITGLPADQIFFLNQIHTAEIIKITSSNQEKLPFVENGDAMITARKNFCLVIRTADCVPVMICDPIQNCIAAIHSGWRSTNESISQKTINRMKAEFHSDPKDLKVYILPSIGPDSYIVKMDVACNFNGHYKEKEEKIYLNLWSCVESDLLASGIKSENIYNTNKCTVNSNESYFSHRKGDRGRNLNFIYIQ